MKRTFVVCAAMMAIQLGGSAEIVEELQPGDGDVTIIEDTGENPDLDSLLGNPDSGLFDNFVNGVWQDPFSMGPGSTGYSGGSTNVSIGYLPSPGSSGNPGSMFAPAANASLELFRLSMPGARLSLTSVDPVPEPGTWAAIVAAGVIGTSVWFRRRTA
jgi:hypothetical protein